MSKTTQRSTSRREFLRSTGRVATASAFLAAVTPRIHAAEDNTIHVALVGCGGRGSGAAANAMAVKGGPIKLYAMADLFADRLQRSYKGLMEAASVPRTGGSADTWIMGHQAEQIDVPPGRQFLGFDAYQKAIDCLRPGDVVILTTPVAFRWVHFRYAIQKGINVFMEKPVTVDGPSTRKMLELAEESERKNLKVGVGLMCRHCKARWELYDRIQSGQIGDLLTLRTYRQHGPAGFTGPNRSNLSELLWQIRNYLGFMWASGGLFQDIIAHNVDECCWMKGAWPVKAQGSGGRCCRDENVDQNFDHYDVECTFADGAKLFIYVRAMAGCRGEFASYAHGT
ncbi:MAG: Gfo/Idh/MocA family oxidoreductase, partial [Phycisphaerae bacterium]|nr:Gfo/Idh/MocA family oxidoreductase [Phycisphaerae bacterium]